MSRSDVLADLLAGLVITAFLVPVGMGYSQASGLPPVYGLYATVVPLLVYAVLGPSRILVLGPDSSLAPLIAATIVPLAAGDPDRAVALAGALSIGAGLVALAAGIGKFGFVTELLSMPVRIGYLNGIAVVVIIGQLPKLLGISVESDMPVGEFVDLVAALGDIERTTASVGVASLLGLVAVRVVAPKLPRSLVVVIGSIVAVEALDLGGDLALVGSLPSGFPVPAIPRIGWGDFSELAAGSLTIAVVSFADTSVLSRAYAKRLDADVDPNAEFIGLGAANVVAGFFQGFPVSASSSRTPVAESAGAKTQLTGVFAALMIVLLLVGAPGLLASLPIATLAAIVILAVIDLVDVRTVFSLARWRRNEFLLSMIAFVGVVVAGVVWGIGVAVGVSLLAFVSQAWRPHVTTLVRIDGVSGYHDIDRHPEGRQVDGLLLFRFGAPLFFANADGFRAEILERVAETPDVQWVVVTAEPITSIDATAQAVIHELHDDLAEQGIELGFAELKGVVRDQIAPGGTIALIGHDRLFPTVGEAVSAFVAATGSDFTDWKTRERPEGSSRRGE
ncbi:MAG: SulP family inorganic anion transporter [Acidimicrobiales bacterium]